MKGKGIDTVTTRRRYTGRTTVTMELRRGGSRELRRYAVGPRIWEECPLALRAPELAS